MTDRGVPESWTQRYFPAIDKRNTSINELHRSEISGVLSNTRESNLLPGELGCAMSHRAAARWLVDSHFDMCLVLEDDIVPNHSDWLQCTISTAVALLPHARRGNAFVCLLGARHDQADRALKRNVRLGATQSNQPKIFLHCDPDRKLWRAHAYLISRGAAERTLRKEQRILTLADDWGERRRLGLIDELFFTRPLLIAQDEKQTSTIDTTAHRETGTDLTEPSVDLFSRVSKSLTFRARMAKARLMSHIPYVIS